MYMSRHLYPRPSGPSWLVDTQGSCYSAQTALFQSPFSPFSGLFSACFDQFN